jgi:RHS repeat-associated protein
MTPWNYTNQETYARRYLYRGWNVIAELDGNGNAIQRSYTWGLDEAGSLTAAGGVGALLRITNYSSGAPTTSYFVAKDGNGNTAALVNASTGAFAAIYEYDPFGQLTRSEVSDNAISDNPFKFSTKYTDTQTGLVYYGNRYYSPGLGRFITQDPSGISGGINLYAFCTNDAINRYDYLGLTDDSDKTIYLPVFGVNESQFSVSDGYIEFGNVYGLAKYTDFFCKSSIWDVGNPQSDRTAGIPGTFRSDTLKIFLETAGSNGSNRTLLNLCSLKTAPERGKGLKGDPNSGLGYQPPGFWASVWQGIAGAPEFWRQAIVSPNAPGSTVIAAIEGAGQGIRNTVSLTAEGAVNIVPLVGDKYGGPGPVGGGLGGAVDVSFNDGVKVTPNVSGGKFGFSGDAGITFTAPGLSGPQVYNFSLSGGTGPGGGINLSFDRNFVPTNISITIGVGFGWEVSGNLPIPVNGRKGP